MRITNVLGLPEPLVRAVERDPYTKGGANYSVTELVAPARQSALMERHWEELTEDVSEVLYRLLGQVGHGILSRAATEGLFIERRLTITVNRVKVTGQVDYFTNERLLTDYKWTSLWSVLDGPKPEWIAQLNLYRLLLEKNGYAVSRAQIVALYRDWSKLAAQRDSSYPRRPVGVFNVPLWDLQETERFLAERIAQHQAARNGELPECTASERWEKPTTYAVVHPKYKKALRVLPSLEEAEKWIATEAKWPKQSTVEVRPGASVRCESYCAASPFCAQWAAIQKKEAA